MRPLDRLLVAYMLLTLMISITGGFAACRPRQPESTAQATATMRISTQGTTPAPDTEQPARPTSARQIALPTPTNTPPPPPGTYTQDGTSTVFVSNQYGYTITLPATWQVETITQTTQLLQINRQQHTSPPAPYLLVADLPATDDTSSIARLTVAVFPAQLASPIEMADEIENTAENATKSTTLTLQQLQRALHHEYTRIHGATGYTSTFDYGLRSDGLPVATIQFMPDELVTDNPPDPEAEKQIFQAILYDGVQNTFVIATFWASRPEYAGLLPQFRQIVQDIRLTERNDHR